jgi:hypothetical protein
MNTTRILVILSRQVGLSVQNPIFKKIKTRHPEIELFGNVHGYDTYTTLQSESIYESLHFIDKLWDESYEYTGELPSSSEIEKELSIPSLWELITCTRNLIYDLELFPLISYRKSCSDETMLNVARYIYKTIKEQFDTIKPQLIISHSYISIYHLLLYHYAQSKNIKMISMHDAKVVDHFMETDNPLNLLMPHFKERYNQLLDIPLDDPIFDKAKSYITKNAQKLSKQNHAIFSPIKLNFKPLIKALLQLPKALIKVSLRKKNTFRKHFKYSDSITPWIHAKRTVGNIIRLKQFEALPFYTPKKEDNYFYFPLQYEPEAHLIVQARYYTNQLETIRLTAKALPGDHTLYVKEHPAMYGHRKKSFYEKIMGLPNVKLISYKYTSEELLKKCTGVVTGTGTALFEASLLGKPSIVYGHDTTTFLPHIFQVENIYDLPKLIQSLLRSDFSDPKYTHAMAAYITTIYEKATPLDYRKVWAGDQNEQDKVVELYLSIIKRYATT